MRKNTRFMKELHNGMRCCIDFAHIMIAFENSFEGKRMSREKDSGVFSKMFGNAQKSFFDQSYSDVEKSPMERPTVNQTPLEGLFQVQRFQSGPQLVERGAGSCAAKLGILRKGNGPLNTVGVHRLNGCLYAGLNVAKGDVVLVRRGLWANFVQIGNQLLALELGESANRRASANGSVLLGD